MTYHLHTEDRPNLPALVAAYFPAFTLTSGTGYWRGQAEPTCIIEIETDDRLAICALANRIKTLNNQESVLIERYRTRSTLVSSTPAAPGVSSDWPVAEHGAYTYNTERKL